MATTVNPDDVQYGLENPQQPTSQPQVEPSKAFLPGEPSPSQPMPPQTAQAQQSTPDYYNAQDPTHQAVWSAYQAKGIAPRDAQDFNYWVDHINSSGGLANGYQATGGTGTWAQRMAAANGGVGDYREGGAPIQGGTFGGGGSFGASYTMPRQDPRLDQLINELVGRSRQSLAVDPNDPIIKAQTDAFRNQMTRGQRSNLAALAEAAGPNSNQTAETRHAGEVVGQQTAGMQAELMAREVDARRKEIADALSGRLGALSLSQQAELHREDEALQARGQDIQSQLGNRGYDITGRANDNAAAQNAWQNQYDLLFGKGY